MDIGSVLPNLHDANLIGIELSDKDAKLKLRLEDGSIRSVVLRDVDRLFCSNFLEGNIVFSARLISAADLTAADAEYFVSMHAVLSDPAAYLERVRASQKVMLLIDSSYGAEFGCVCAEIDVE
jgi:hypothetical protein